MKNTVIIYFILISKYRKLWKYCSIWIVTIVKQNYIEIITWPLHDCTLSDYFLLKKNLRYVIKVFIFGLYLIIYNNQMNNKPKGLFYVTMDNYHTNHINN